MDFALTEEQEALQGLARQILDDRVTPERLKEIEAGPIGFDRETWAELAKANLLGLAVPQEHGGSGFGLFEVCLVLEEVGRAVAPVPALGTLAFGALPVAEFGTPAQRDQWLPGVVTGETILTAGLEEEDGPLAVDGGSRLSGTLTNVPYGALADRVVVAAGGDLWLVDPAGAGVTVEAQGSTSGQPTARIELAGAAAERLGDGSRSDAAAWLRQRATAGICAVQAGVCERALRMTAEYTSTRRQFDKPLASFQAVSQRAADAFIDVEAVRLTARQAAWRLGEGLPAEAEVAVAKFWAAEGGQRVVHAAQHLHGGIGVDVDYPLHRYFLWAKEAELALGSATPQLVELGRLIAAGDD